MTSNCICKSDEQGVSPKIEKMTANEVFTYVRLTANDNIVKIKEKIFYTVIAGNSGKNNATGVVVFIFLPDGVKGCTNPSYSYNNGIIEWKVGELSSGQVKTLFIPVEVIKVGCWNTKACINQSEPNPTNNKCSTATLRVVNSIADLNVSICARRDLKKKYKRLGDEIVFRIIVRNYGPDTATEVYALAILPPEVSYLRDNSCGKYNYKTGEWNIGFLREGESKTLFITVRAIEAGNTIIRVFVNAQQQDSNYDNNSSKVEIPIFCENNEYRKNQESHDDSLYTLNK